MMRYPRGFRWLRPGPDRPIAWLAVTRDEWPEFLFVLAMIVVPLGAMLIHWIAG